MRILLNETLLKLKFIRETHSSYLKKQQKNREKALIKERLQNYDIISRERDVSTVININKYQQNMRKSKRV